MRPASARAAAAGWLLIITAALLVELGTAALPGAAPAEATPGPSDLHVVQLAGQVRDLHHGGSTEKTFSHYDSDNDGALGRAELKRLLGDHKTTRGFFTKSIKAGRLMRQLDRNNDSVVDLTEFRQEL